MAWWAEHRDIVIGLLVALFGAGGAGAILLQWLLRDRHRKPPKAPTSAPATGDVHSQASGGSTIITKFGDGDVLVERGETASPRLMRAWGTRGVAGSEFATVWRAAERAGLTARQMEQIAWDSDHEREFEVLRDAVSHRDVEAAACQLRALAERASLFTRSD